VRKLRSPTCRTGSTIRSPAIARVATVELDSDGNPVLTSRHYPATLGPGGAGRGGVVQASGVGIMSGRSVEVDLVARNHGICMIACEMLALCDMKTLYLRNVPDDVVQRLERLAARDATSVGAVAIRELAEVSRRADNPALLGVLPDLNIDVATIVEDLDDERGNR